MGWGGDYRTPEEQTELDAQRDAAAEAQLRSRLSHYERRTLDTLTDIATSVAAIAEVFVSMNEREIASGLTCAPKWIRDMAAYTAQQGSALFGNPDIAAGDGGDVSAGPGDPSGPARPDSPN